MQTSGVLGRLLQGPGVGVVLLDVREAVLHTVDRLHHPVGGLQQPLQDLRPGGSPLSAPAGKRFKDFSSRTDHCSMNAMLLVALLAENRVFVHVRGWGFVKQQQQGLTPLAWFSGAPSSRGMVGSLEGHVSMSGVRLRACDWYADSARPCIGLSTMCVGGGGG